MTAELPELGWIINHKKVYRLMKEARLLYGARIRPAPFKRNFIRFRSLKPERPLQYLAMDIKYAYIHGTGRNVLLLKVIDIFSRKVLIYQLRSHIRKGDILVMLSLMLLEYRAEGMSISNDNGSQFIVHVVRGYLERQGHPSGILPCRDAGGQRLYRSVPFQPAAGGNRPVRIDSIYHAQMILDRYYEW